MIVPLIPENSSALEMALVQSGVRNILTSVVDALTNDCLEGFKQQRSRYRHHAVCSVSWKDTWPVGMFLRPRLIATWKSVVCRIVIYEAVESMYVDPLHIPKRCGGYRYLTLPLPARLLSFYITIYSWFESGVLIIERGR